MKKCMFSLSRFTLIELIVVVAVIGVLVSLLLPSLSKARLVSRTAVTISNMKQMYQGTVSYSTSNDGSLFVTTSNYHIRNNDRTTNWTRMVFEEINGALLPSDNAGAQQLMQKGTVYYSLMFCPVLRLTRPDGGQHPQGRSDFGMNKYFRDAYRKMAQVDGKKEPFIMPTTNPGSSHAGPNLNHADYNPSETGHPVYEYSSSRSLSLFIAGNIRFISLSEGATLQPLVNRVSDFQ